MKWLPVHELIRAVCEFSYSPDAGGRLVESITMLRGLNDQASLWLIPRDLRSSRPMSQVHAMVWFEEGSVTSRGFIPVIKVPCWCVAHADECVNLGAIDWSNPYLTFLQQSVSDNKGKEKKGICRVIEKDQRTYLWINLKSVIKVLNENNVVSLIMIWRVSTSTWNLKTSVQGRSAECLMYVKSHLLSTIYCLINLSM